MILGAAQPGGPVPGPGLGRRFDDVEEDDTAASQVLGGGPAEGWRWAQVVPSQPQVSSSSMGAYCSPEQQPPKRSTTRLTASKAALASARGGGEADGCCSVQEPPFQVQVCAEGEPATVPPKSKTWLRAAS